MMIEIIALLFFFTMIWIILCSIVPFVYITCEKAWHKPTTNITTQYAIDQSAPGHFRGA